MGTWSLCPPSPGETPKGEVQLFPQAVLRSLLWSLEPAKQPSLGQPIKLASLALCLEGAAVWRVTSTLLFAKGGDQAPGRGPGRRSDAQGSDTVSTRNMVLECRLLQEALRDFSSLYLMNPDPVSQGSC